ncbi:MAG: OmpA family protein [Rikenellaceae bacterium]
MKTTRIRLIILLAAIMPLVNGCVTTKNYRNTKAELIGYQMNYEQLRQENEDLQEQVDRLSGQKNAQSDRSAELENLLAQREARLFEINQIIEDALSSFNDRGLSVTTRDGRIYVSLEEKLLFESGKSELSAEGIRAILRLSEVLADNPTINITIEGHTDNTGYIARSDAQIVDNWDLSCKRATEVVRVMTRNSRIDPIRIIASGRSQYLPLVSGSSATARASNRRTEIILTPQIDQIWNLLNK